MTALPAFQLIRAATVADAILARKNHPGSQILAGGTDLITNMRRGLGATEFLVDIAAIPELQEITVGPKEIRIGAAVTLARIARDARIAKSFPALCAAAASVAGPSHRTVATLGGNLCLDTRCVFYNQSAWWRRSNDFCLKYGGTVCHVAPTGKRCHAAYSGDLAPALLVAGAAAEIAGPAGMRSLPVADLFQEDGAAHLRLAADDILVAVRLPISPRLASAYEKVRFRGAIDFPLAGVAVALGRRGENIDTLRIALTGTNARPFLLANCDELTGKPLDEIGLGRIDKLVQQQVSPMRTTTVQAHYRRRVAAALAVRLVRRTYDAAGR